MSPIRTAAALAGASFAAVTLAGCAGGASASGPASSAASSPSSSDTAGSASSSSSSAGGSFKDGSYTARGEYTSPGGLSAVDVTVTLKGDTVTAVKVVPKAENPTAKGYEAQFASGVGPKVVGKKLTELDVTKVSGSSLTSQGFDRAIEDIQKQAS